MRDIIKSSSADILRDFKLSSLESSPEDSEYLDLSSENSLDLCNLLEEQNEADRSDRLSMQERIHPDTNSILYAKIEEYNEVACLLMEPVCIEILGVRCSGKSSFLYGLLRVNYHLFPQLIITKGPVPEIDGTKVHTATSMDEMISVLETVIKTQHITKTQILGIDTLITLLNVERTEEKKHEVFFLLKVLNALGVRVVVITSLIETVRRSSDFYHRSILFRRLPYSE
ncbi:hypothetical protein NEAUS04_2385 [Nematocida ausubeli]|nr:hypothetical protein NEAUS07_2244 [Nematocida ausubeli]KAI5164947.1 hypothetical protein NEAUS04_2385 [Nematocida ausubeli]